ncbi:MAG: hypothetical protein HOM08_12475 [Candidatus Marinimicrobia bacterium]|jgi:WD40 repeat protein|nr:hypothetical protein [Candidatus Neomarinimicrobiota bacterium]
MIFKNSRQVAITIILIANSLFAQSKHPEVNIIETGSRGYINNPDWSNDSNLLAFEFKPANAPTKIMVVDVSQGISAIDLFSNTPSTSSLLITIDQGTMRLPQWSQLINNSLYLLRSDNRSRLLSKIDRVTIKDLPMKKSLLKPLDKTMKQESQIVEYYPQRIELIEYLFIRQQNTPGMIDYTDQFGDISKISGLEKFVGGSELIDSFNFSKLSPKLLLCKGQDNQKQIIIGILNIQMGGIESVDYEIVNVEKSPSSALQEPSFSPGSDDLFAYLEVKKNSHDMTSYELLIHSLERQESYHLTDNIYRNEENKTSQPLSTSYAWHPTQNIIYFIDKFSNRSILLADYSDLSNPTIQELSLELEYVENLSVSPDGKYLAAITSSSSFSESEDALNQLHLITLDVK